MKSAYLDKIENLKAEMVKMSIEKRKLKKSLNDELKEEIYAKMLFIKQIGEIKRNVCV